jgi:hypothetical protein
MQMPRKRRHKLSDAFDLMRLGADAWMVVALRCATFGAGGPRAALEAQRMIAEKSAAALEAQIAAGFALATGATTRAASRKAMSGYRRRVKANRRRLVRKR